MKHCITLLLIGVLALPAWAQAPAASKDTTLGRLFMTPEKRHTLDRQRKLDIRDTDGAEVETLELNGVVQRSNGRSSIWINQRMQYGQEPQGARIRRGQPGTTDIEMDNGTSTPLQVGDSINRSTQERKGLVPPHAVQSGKKP
jgi:hypothetical protein